MLRLSQVEGVLRVFETSRHSVPLIVLFLFYSIPLARIFGEFAGLRSFRVLERCLPNSSLPAVRINLIASGPTLIPLPTFLGLVVWTGPFVVLPTEPRAPRAIPLEKEYQRMAAATQRRLHDARGYLAKAVGS